MRTPVATRNALILKRSMEIDMEMALRMRNRVWGLGFAVRGSQHISRASICITGIG